MSTELLTLPQALATPLGRSTLLTPEAEAQLLGLGHSLTNRYCRLYDAVGEQLRHLLGAAADLPPRQPHAWTLLTEAEHPAWPLLALSQPPVLPAAATARAARHLLSAHRAMSAPRGQEWALQLPDIPAERDAPGLLLAQLGSGPSSPDSLTWADLLAALLTVQAHHALLPLWGVLSAHVGLNPHYRQQGMSDLQRALLARPDLCHDPAELARVSLWAALWPLHGGLPVPQNNTGVTELARTLRDLNQRTWQAVTPDQNPHDLLREWLPAAADPAALQKPAPGPDSSQMASGLTSQTGLALVQKPGQVAYWFRRPGQLQVLAWVLRGDQMTAQAWNWPSHSSKADARADAQGHTQDSQ